MKKLLALALTLTLLLALPACGGKAASEASSDEEASTSDVLLPEEHETPEEAGDVAADEGQEQAPTEDEAQEAETQPPAATAKPESGKTDKPTSGTNSNTAASNAGSTKPSTGNSSANANTNSGANTNTSSGSNTGTGTAKPETGKDAETAKGYSGSLPDLVTAIYAKKSVDLPLADPIAVDLSDSNSASYFLGLSDGSKLQEAYYSESMIGSQAYSLVVARAKNAADATSVARSMYDGIDQSKWICVTADALAVGVSGDTILLVMADTELSPTLHTDLRDAFASVVGGKLDLSLDRFA